MAILMGINGEDNFMGNPEANTIFGVGDSDTINENIGNNKIYGELGNDLLRGSAGLGSLDGGKAAAPLMHLKNVMTASSVKVVTMSISSSASAV
jgi:hypothetical protein